LNVRYRDIRHLVAFLAQIWLFATPVAYPSSLIPERWQWLAGLNPMSGLVEGFRWAVLGTPFPEWPLMAMSAAISIVLLLAGLVLFHKTESGFADII
jgi:lipopolysaccharide transport system permease protein